MPTQAELEAAADVVGANMPQGTRSDFLAIALEILEAAERARTPEQTEQAR